MRFTSEDINILTAINRDLGNHGRNTGQYAFVLAQYCPILCDVYQDVPMSEVCEAVRYAGYMHDLGKIMYSPVVLDKPGKLSPAEMEIMKVHPKRSFELLQEDPLFQKKDPYFQQIVGNGCLYHHERYDGSGYPFGLVKKQVPLVAELIALCDVLDALTTSRSYKPAWGFEEAFNYLQQEERMKYSSIALESLIRAKAQLLSIKGRIFCSNTSLSLTDVGNSVL